MNVFNDVKDFHVFFGHRVNEKPTWIDSARESFRLGLIEEEYNELKAALSERDMVEVADALADLVYVVIGTAIEMGIPFQEVWNAVHNSNMEKAIFPYHSPTCKLVTSDKSTPNKCNCGSVQYTGSGKTAKPDGWEPPTEKIKKIIERYR